MTAFMDGVVGAALGQAGGDAFGFQVERSGPGPAAAHVNGWLHEGTDPEPMRDGYALGQVSDDTQCARLLMAGVVASGRYDLLAHAQALVGSAGDLVGAGGNTLRMLRALSMTDGLARGDIAAALAEREDALDAAGPGEASNGAVMRAWPHAVLHADRRALAEAVLADAALTHAHPESGACAVTAALATRLLLEGVEVCELLPALRDGMPTGGETGSVDLAERLGTAGDGAPDMVWDEAGRPPAWRSVAPGARVTVAWALHALVRGSARNPDANAVLAGAVSAGGDVDTTAALAMGWFGASVGPGFLQPWLVRRVTDRGRWGPDNLAALAGRFADLGVEPRPGRPGP